MYKDELTDLIIKGLKTLVPSIAKEYGDEDIYALSLEAYEGSSFTLYVNTEENHARRVAEAAKETRSEPDPWYFRFSEYEWYIISDPEALDEAVDFINNGYATFDETTVYECIADAVAKLREEKFFVTVFPHNIFFSINAVECFDQEDLISLIVKMNGEENSKDYIENIDSFY